MNIRETKTVRLKLTELHDNHGQIQGVPANPRFVRDKQYKRLLKSLKEGDLTGVMPIKVYQHDGEWVVIGGNMRLRAMQELKIADVSCIVIPAGTDTETICKIAMIDNSTFGEWDFDMLANEWSELPLEDWGLEVPTGWGGSEEAQEDDFDEEKDKVETVCKKGDIWQLGNHRLMCGDSTSREDVARLMDGEKADMCFTDPPFGNDLGYGRGQLGERRIANDEDTDILYKVFGTIDAALKNDTHCLVWIQWRTFSELEKAFEKYKLRTVVVWDKMQAGLSGGGFAEQYEMCCVFIKGHATQNHYSGNIWQVPRVHAKREDMPHPHQKPIEVLAKGFDMCGKTGDIVLDLFGGSGSTLIACEQLGRKCYMMELDPHYCDIIIARWEKMTNNRAIKL